MAGMDWFRWHHGSVTDPKFQLVAKKAGSSVAEVIGVWAMLLEAASMADERGVHGVLDFESLDCSLGLPDGKAQQIYNLMADRYLVDPQTRSIHAWSRRQPLREREDVTAAERKRNQRGREPLDATNVTPNTAQQNHVTPSHTKKSLEERRGEEIREEKEGGECARPSSPTGSPPPFFPEYREFIKTERPDLDADVVFSNFLDHYPPAKCTAANWRKWVRREHPGSSHAAGPPKADPDSRLSIETMGLSLGFGQWDQLVERWESYKSRVKKGVPA